MIDLTREECGRYIAGLQSKIDGLEADLKRLRTSGWALLNGEDPWDVVIRLRADLTNMKRCHDADALELGHLRASAEAFQNEARILRGHLTDRDAEAESLRAQKEYLEELLHAERALKGGE